jgi:hypothetical protein
MIIGPMASSPRDRLPTPTKTILSAGIPPIRALSFCLSSSK